MTVQEIGYVAVGYVRVVLDEVQMMRQDSVDDKGREHPDVIWNLILQDTSLADSGGNYSFEQRAVFPGGGIPREILLHARFLELHPRSLAFE